MSVTDVTLQQLADSWRKAEQDAKRKGGKKQTDQELELQLQAEYEMARSFVY